MYWACDKVSSMLHALLSERLFTPSISKKLCLNIRQKSDSQIWKQIRYWGMFKGNGPSLSYHYLTFQEDEVDLMNTFISE